MNTILLEPIDVLFFRDGRPMDGASSGHGAAWPLPHVINAAFHAALHRAGLQDVHEHRQGRSSDREDQTRNKVFGSLVTAGPFPVDAKGNWHLPRPADAQLSGSAKTTMHPLTTGADASSLDRHLYPIVNSKGPCKETSEAWMNREAWAAYLSGDCSSENEAFIEDDAFSMAEHQIGIAIDPDTDTTIEGAFFSASYLRLKPGWKLGVLAEAMDKVNGATDDKRDLISALLDGEQHLIVGGQQRVCSAQLEKDAEIPLPIAPQISGTRVRWTLLTPAVFPRIGEHPGGWLPSWVDKDSYELHLLDGPGKNKARRMKVPMGETIRARLVAATVPRATPITGWAVGDEGGAKSTHLAVPAGTVYYFETEDEAQAQKLAAALNWHGTARGKSNTIINRRSTLFGEKGFGLGVCSAWQDHQSFIQARS